MIKRLFILLALITSPLLSMQDNEKNDLKEMLLVAAANGKANWIHTLTGFHGAKELVNSAVNEQGATPLLIACQEGHIETVKVLLNEGGYGFAVHLIKTPDGRTVPCTPLHMAAAQGHAEIVEILLQHDRGDVNTPHSPKQRTPLHLATANGHVKVIATLIAHCANIHEEDIDDVSVLTLAAQHPDPLVLEEFQKQLPLFDTIEDLGDYFHIDDLIWIKEVIAAKIDLERINPEYGETALIYAARSGLPEVVELLIHSGANVWARNREELTALDVAQKTILNPLGTIQTHSSKRRNLEKVCDLLKSAMDKATEAHASKEALLPLAIEQFEPPAYAEDIF